MPPEKKKVDPRSLIIGFLCAAVLLLFIALANSKKEQEPVVAAPAPAPAPTGYISDFQQEQMAARTLEGQIQSMLDELIGVDRSVVRVRVMLDADGELHRQHVALSIDKTKVIQDPSTGQYIEEDRTEEEIDQLAKLAMLAAGLDKERGRIAVYPINFDKTQEIMAREMAAAEARQHFWTRVLWLAVPVAALFLLIRHARKNPESDLIAFLTAPESKVALLLAAGLVLCAGALGFWHWRALIAVPGIYSLLIGLHRGRDLLQGKPAKSTPAKKTPAKSKSRAKTPAAASAPQTPPAESAP